MRLSLIHIYRPICTRNAYICPPPAVHAGRRKETSLLCVQTTHDAKIIKLADFQDLYAVRSLELVGVCAFDALPPLIPCRAKSRLPAEPKSVLVCAFPYQLPPASYVERNLSRSAVVPDYHLVAGKMLDDIAVALTVRFSGVYQ